MILHDESIRPAKFIGSQIIYLLAFQTVHKMEFLARILYPFSTVGAKQLKQQTSLQHTHSNAQRGKEPRQKDSSNHHREEIQLAWAYYSTETRSILNTRASNLVSLATEPTETFEFLLNELSDLCGKRAMSPSFWRSLKNHYRDHDHILADLCPFAIL